MANHDRRDGRFGKRRRAGRLAGSGPIIAGVLCATLLVEIAIGEQGIRAVAAVVQDPASLLSARSPGARAEGAMFNTKGGHQRTKAAVRALPDRAGPDAAIPPAAFLGVPMLDEGVLEPEPAAYAALLPDQGPFAGGPLLSFPFGGVPIFGGGIPGGPGNPGGAIPPPPASAVPEPASWLMLIVGLFATGGLLRSRRTTRVSVS